MVVWTHALQNAARLPRDPCILCVDGALASSLRQGVGWAVRMLVKYSATVVRVEQLRRPWGHRIVECTFLYFLSSWQNEAQPVQPVQYLFSVQCSTRTRVPFYLLSLSLL